MKKILFGQFFWAEAFFLCFLFLAKPLPAQELAPFQTQNQSPLVQIYGLPAPGDAFVLSKGKGHVGLIADLANNYVTDSASREDILLDGESYRFTLEGRYGLGHGMEVGLEVPYIAFSGGFMDGAIDSWHDAFGFSDGGRNLALRNRLRITYQRDHQEKLRIDQSSSGLGDVRLKAGLRLYEERKGGASALTLRGSLKLPTGDSDFLHGSGSTDLALWLIGSHEIPWTYGPWFFFGSAGVLGMTTGQVLEDQQRNWVGFGSAGIGYRPFSWMGLKIQANGNTSFYQDSDLRELALASIQLLTGGTLFFSEKISLDVAVSEDVIIKTSPDVVFHLALNWRF